LISTHQNNLKTPKIYQFEAKKKKIKFKKNTFETQKQIKFYEIQLKKHVKTSSQKLRFKLNFLVDPAIQNTVWFVTKHLVVFVPLQT
jgi:hypothetical protein